MTLGPGCALVDLGSGSGIKTRILLENLILPAAYVPVDVSHAQLREHSARLVAEYPQLAVLPLCADYMAEFDLPEFPPHTQQTVAFFPGSTIGNLDPEEAAAFLGRIAGLCGDRGAVLAGVDLKKNPSMLDAAYHDSQGVTAAFNLNLLARANREAGADFDLALFRHHAFYNELAGRVEMHLVSQAPQLVRVGRRRFAFAAGEPIVTEYSYKYSIEEFERLARRGGFRVSRWWTDENQWFGVFLLSRPPRSR